MKKFNLNDMKRGWFVGDFEPTCFSTSECEVAVKRYNAGDQEEKHMHKIATEITLVINGTLMMNNIEYHKGDVILMEPGESTDFKAITDATNVVVKIPCVKGDKYIV